MNMAALVNQSDLSGHQGKNLANIINFEHVNSEEWGDEWGCMGLVCCLPCHKSGCCVVMCGDACAPHSCVVMCGGA